MYGCVLQCRFIIAALSSEEQVYAKIPVYRIHRLILIQFFRFTDPFFLPKEQVDKGAIRFVLSGANIMCPGLTSPGAIMTPVEKGTVVVSGIMILNILNQDILPSSSHKQSIVTFQGLKSGRRRLSMDRVYQMRIKSHQDKTEN